MSVYLMPEETPTELFAETMFGHLHGASVRIDCFDADAFNACFYATKGTLS